MSELKVDAVVQALEDYLKGSGVAKGAHILIDRLYVHPRSVLDNLFGNETWFFKCQFEGEVRDLLAKAYKQGRVDRLKKNNRWAYTTLRIKQDIDTERGLSDGERAERTTAFYRTEVEHHLTEYPERPNLWPTDGRGWYPDGVQAAAEVGLLVHIEGSKYLPAEYVDRYLMAKETYDHAQAVIKQRLKDTQRRVQAIAPRSDHSERYIDLQLSQVERLLAMITKEEA